MNKKILIYFIIITQSICAVKNFDNKNLIGVEEFLEGINTIHEDSKTKSTARHSMELLKKAASIDSNVIIGNVAMQQYLKSLKGSNFINDRHKFNPAVLTFVKQYLIDKEQSSPF